MDPQGQRPPADPGRQVVAPDTATFRPLPGCLGLQIVQQMQHKRPQMSAIVRVCPRLSASRSDGCRTTCGLNTNECTTYDNRLGQFAML